ncbi:dermonecrotic toxin domain-containing protein [Pseudomonas reactans]
MSQVQPPYFFPEVLRSGWKERDRERHFGINANDRRFLLNLSLSSNEVRRKQSPPMIAQSLWLNKNSPTALELVGSFMMSSTGTYTSAFLYTPYGGLEKFDSRALLLSALTERLKTPAKADELLQFIALGTRSGLKLDTPLVLTPVDIEGDVFDEQKKSLNHQQTLNLQAVLAELVKLPNLDTMLQALLRSVFHSLFPRFDPNRTRVNFFKLPPTEGGPRQWVNSLSISEALLMLYRQQAWPVGQTREFFHPQSVTASNDATRWEDGLKQASEQLSSFLQNTLETFWNTVSPNDTSRRKLLAQTMAQRARIDLLLKRQSEIITPEQADELAALYHVNGAPRTQASDGLRFETVRFWEHPSHFVELTSSVMIGNAHTWFYSPPKGLQVLADHDDLIKALKAMVKAPAYEDDVYNFLSLEERLLFIGFTEPSVSGNLIVGNVFEHLMEGIIDKQRQNLMYVLGQFRREHGDINLSALLDHAMDVRFMVDDKLLTLDTAHRWTTHSVLADPLRPIPVAAKRAEQAYKQLIDMSDALEAQITSLPSITAPLADELSRREQRSLNLANLYIHLYAEDAVPSPLEWPLGSTSVAEQFAKRLTENFRPIPELPRYGIYERGNTGYGKKLSKVDVKTFNQIVDNVVDYYKENKIEDIPRQHLEIRQLLLKLNIAQDAQDYLKEKLAPNQPGALERELHFIRQLPWQLLQHAHALKLQERLSETGYNLIRQVVDMPDAIARSTIAGATATIRPLEMIATPRASIVKALGLYVISASATGPLILYAPYYPGDCFIEFENPERFLSHLNVPGKLQDWITSHLEGADKTQYKNLLASTADTTSEITLANQPIKGHAIKQLYQDNQAVMGRMLQDQQDPDGRSRWEIVKNLLSNVVQIAAQFLPGKLQIPILLWQSYELFKDSAEALQQHHWRHALRSFILGIASMAGVGWLLRTPAPNAPPLAHEEVGEDALSTSNPVVAPAVKDIDVTDPRRTRLQSLETSQVALQDLQKQAGTGFYVTADGKTLYGAVEGKVYPIKNIQQLRIADTSASGDGPLLSSTPRQQLVLAPNHHPLQYGMALGTLGNNFVTRWYAGLDMNIEASGMEEIRRLYPIKARQIIETLMIARAYALRAMHNMAQLQTRGSNPRIEEIMRETFDVAHINADTRAKVYEAIKPLCEALQDPDLDGWNMSRFVVGARRNPLNKVIAFVVEGDLQNRVFFTDLFFDQRELQTKYAHLLTTPFNVAGHSRAASLIHEFSHLYSRTEDITYTEARRPFPDLIELRTRLGRYQHTLLQDFQRNVLSLRTPINQLFSRWRRTSARSGVSQSSGYWESMNPADPDDLAAQAVLQTTATTSIQDARTAFLNTASADMTRSCATPTPLPSLFVKWGASSTSKIKITPWLREPCQAPGVRRQSF